MKNMVAVIAKNVTRTSMVPLSIKAHCECGGEFEHDGFGSGGDFVRDGFCGFGDDNWGHVCNKCQAEKRFTQIFPRIEYVPSDLASSTITWTDADMEAMSEIADKMREDTSI